MNIWKIKEKKILKLLNSDNKTAQFISMITEFERMIVNFMNEMIISS